MFNIGFTELLLILAIALIVVGPKKLPGIAHSLGKIFSEFRSATKDFKDALEAEADLSEKPPAKLKAGTSGTRWPEEETGEFPVEEAGETSEEKTPTQTEKAGEDEGKEADHAG